MSALNGIGKLYSLFKRTDIDKEMKNKSAICIGQLFRAKQLPDEMRSEITSHLKSLVNDSDEWTKNNSIGALAYLAQNLVNNREIVKGRFKIPQ
ncbi:MAG: hypothetical protein EZS28_049767 [Streblomastix strix]|uniref:Uncharacterized protein n=1 Tax=Streblomastix strix TaxID=222440 RepID=A0A5J4T8Z3_9EUKA|nr:MAG: hypothetical protein EZS28_049767 [Streblomastix strix]